MNNHPEPFFIVLTKDVVFLDRTGTVLKTYKTGDKLLATFKTQNYFITAMGGIYLDEAVELVQP